MAAVRIVRDPIASDSAADVPRQHWDTLMEERQRFCTQYLPKDCRNLLFFVEDGVANNWIGYGSRKNYIRKGLGLDPKMVDWAVIGLHNLRPGHGAIKFDLAAAIGKLAKHGTNQHTRTGVRNTNSSDTVSYAIARLNRDRPDLAAKVNAGELSANAAAIEAGFRRPPSPLKAIQNAWSRATDDQRRAIRAWWAEQ